MNRLIINYGYSAGMGRDYNNVMVIDEAQGDIVITKYKLPSTYKDARIDINNIHLLLPNNITSQISLTFDEVKRLNKILDDIVS